MAGSVRGAILDLDGTVYRGDDPLPGAADAVAALRDRGLELGFCSNNPTKTPAEYVERLAGMGIDADAEEVLPASTVTRQYLLDHHAEERIFLLGVESLSEYFADAGLDVASDPADADVYVASWTRSFGYADMVAALQGVDAETTFLGTDPDRTIPTAEGEVPGSGAVIGAVARTLDRDPDVTLGKPSRQAGEMALDLLGVPAEAVLVVGDRLDTDLAMGERFGMRTVLVETGVDDRSDVPGREPTVGDVTPDHVVDSLADVPGLLEG